MTDTKEDCSATDSSGFQYYIKIDSRIVHYAYVIATLRTQSAFLHQCTQLCFASIFMFNFFIRIIGKGRTLQNAK